MAHSTADFKTAVGARIKSRLEQLGKKPIWLGSEAGLSMASVWAYVGGQRLPNLEAADAIARALGVSLDWLTGRQETPNN